MEKSRKIPPKKLKSVNACQLSSAAASSNAAASAFAYKHFNSANSKRRKNRKKYFEHDTRTRTIRTSVATKPNVIGGGGGGVGAAAIKKIKFNNEIRIIETKCNNDVDNKGKTKKKKPPNKNQSSINAQKKRAMYRRTTSAAANAANIQTTTKKLQKQLIETQKKLQKQLNALQEHQREQNHSFLALLHSNCMHPSAKHDNNNSICTIKHDQTQPPPQQQQQQQLTHAKSPQSTSDGLHTKTLNQNNPYSEHYFTHNFFQTDQSKCSIDKMANGNKATAIRAFTCESKSKNCSVSSTDADSKLISPSNADLCTYHHCSSCIGYSNANSVAIYSAAAIDAAAAAAVADAKKPKIQTKKPLLKSIILSTNNSSASVLNIKREIDDSSECNRTICPIEFNSAVPVMTKIPESKSQPIDMQFTDTKKTKQINSYFKSHDNFVQQTGRSYSPPLPANHRLASMVTSDASNTVVAHNQTRRSQSSRDRKCNKKRKKRRRSHSRDSRSRSRSYSRSQSSSRSRTRSRSRSYRRRSSRSRSSNSEYESRRYSQERKKKSHSKNRDVFRRSSKRDERNSSCGCSCNCTNYCKKSSSKHSNMSANKSKSPSNDSALSSKPSNISSCDSKSIKRSTTSSSDANGSTSKKKPVTISSGVLLKQQPIVKLHSSPATGSDTENEVDDKFDRKYEELLTFETNEDERREQRLLKALSDIAAKAKQKIQSISDSGVAKIVHADRNHNDRVASKTNKTLKNCTKKPNETHDDRRPIDRQPSEERYEDDYSPRDNRKHTKRESSRRSRRDSSCSSSSSKDEKSPRSSRSPSIPRRRGSPSFLDRRRITSARKKPIPYQRSSPYDSLDEWESS